MAKVRGSRKMGAGHGELVQLSTGARPGGACACACVCVGVRGAGGGVWGVGGVAGWGGGGWWVGGGGGGAARRPRPHWQLPEPQQAYQGGGEGGMLQ